MSFSLLNRFDELLVPLSTVSRKFLLGMQYGLQSLYLGTKPDLFLFDFSLEVAEKASLYDIIVDRFRLRDLVHWAARF